MKFIVLLISLFIGAMFVLLIKGIFPELWIEILLAIALGNDLRKEFRDTPKLY